MEAMAQVIGQSKDDVMDSKGVHRDNTIEIPDGPINQQYADELAMAEEPVEVMVHESTDPNADNPVWVSCNGTNQFFYRGKPITVKRKYLEILARAKHTTISTVEGQGYDGERTTRIKKATALKYPFSVLTDNNRNGSAWLKAVLAQP